MPDDMQQDRQRSGIGGGYTPVPDPTVLTTEALQREIGALKELIEQRLLALGGSLRAEHKGEIDRLAEKFKSIDAELTLVERQRVEQKQDTKAAVDAALTAQKEAVKEQTTASERAIAKSEGATTKSIEQLGDKFDTAIDGLRREVADVKERVTGAEGSARGLSHAKEGIQAWQIMVAGAFVTLFVTVTIILANVVTGV